MGTCASTVDCIFIAYIANAETYHTAGLGETAGIWHHFPTTTEDIQETLDTIGVSDGDDSGYVVEDYQSSLMNLQAALKKLPTRTAAGELNHLAGILQGFTDDEIEQFGAALLLDKHKGTIRGAISIAENIDIVDQIRKVCIRG